MAALEAHVPYGKIFTVYLVQADKHSTMGRGGREKTPPPKKKKAKMMWYMWENKGIVKKSFANPEDYSSSSEILNLFK